MTPILSECLMEVLVVSAMENPRLELTDDGQCIQLKNAYKISPAHKTDLMVLQCNASNVHGYGYSQGYINVLGTHFIHYWCN